MAIQYYIQPAYTQLTNMDRSSKINFDLHNNQETKAVRFVIGFLLETSD